MKDFEITNARIKSINKRVEALIEEACTYEAIFYAQYGDDYATQPPVLEAPYELHRREPRIPTVTVPDTYKYL